MMNTNEFRETALKILLEMLHAGMAEKSHSYDVALVNRACDMALALEKRLAPMERGAPQDKHELNQSCPLGMTRDDVLAAVGFDKIDAFDKFMRGQTTGICPCAEKHGNKVYFTCDVKRFLANQPCAD